MQDFPEENEFEKDEESEDSNSYDDSLPEDYGEYLEKEEEGPIHPAQEEAKEDTEEEGDNPPKKNPKKEEVKKEMDDFRQQLVQYRDSHFNKDFNYESIEEDDDYASLLEEGDLSKHEEVIERFYPSAEEIFKKRPPVVRDPNNDPLKYKLSKAEVYIREFREDPEVVRAQIQQMKTGATESGEITQKIGSNIKELQSEIPVIQKDLERYVGENLLNKIALLIILAAVAVLYQYAITQGYINETLRIVVGGALGVGFITLAHLILSTVQRTRTLFMGLGAATLLYTISLSFQDYGVLDQTKAFVANVLVGLVLVFYTIRYERKDMATLAYLALFCAPLLVSTGDKNPLFFFSYLLIVDLILLFISYKRQWHVIMVLTYVISFFAFQVFVFTNDYGSRVDHVMMLSFAAIFYATYFMYIVAYNLQPKVTYRDLDYFLLMLSTLIFLFNGIKALNGIGATEYRPGFIAGLGFFQLYYAFMLYGNKKLGEGVHRQLLVFFIGMVSIAIWMEFSALYVNIWWAIEGVFLAWLGIRMNNTLLRNGSALITSLSLGTMLYNWTQTYFSSQTLPLVFNSGFASGLITVVSLSTLVTLFNSDKKEYDIIAITKVYYAKSLATFLIIISFSMGIFELLWHAPNLDGSGAYRTILIDAYTMLFALLMRFIVHKLDIRRLKESVGWFMGLSVIFYIVFGHRAALELRSGYLEGTLPFYPFGTHYLNVVISVLLNYILIRDIVSSESYASGKYSFAMWFLCIVIIFHMSYELEHTIVLIRAALSVIPNIEDFLYQVRLTGFSVLWSLLSFVFMYIGLRYKLKELRMISLVLLAVTILKFFAFDFRKLETFGQIVALVVIGVFLLAVSQLYSKLRKMLSLDGPLFDKDHNYSQDETAAIIKAHQAMKKKQGEQPPE